MALLVLVEGIKVNAILNKNGFVPTKMTPISSATHPTLLKCARRLKRR